MTAMPSFSGSAGTPGREKFSAGTPADGDVEIAAREIVVPGVRNFRDIGGLRVRGGVRIRRGLVFRSAKFDRLEPAGAAVLAELGVRTIVDFRSSGERVRNPSSPALDGFARTVNFPVFADVPDGYFEEKLPRGLSPEDAIAFMEEANRSFVRERREAFRAFFALFDDVSNFPLVFHCVGGKDRTGFAAAMLLSVLGASDEDIFADYLLSRKNAVPEAERAASRLLEIVSPETLRVLTTVFPEFLAASLREIDAVWGSRERFLREGLGVSDERAGKIRALLLPAS